MRNHLGPKVRKHLVDDCYLLLKVAQDLPHLCPRKGWASLDLEVCLGLLKLAQKALLGLLVC